MYETYFGFREKPFSILPDPTFLYLGQAHRMAFAMLEYGVRNRAGFTVITGEIGSGKTTLIRRLLSQMPQTLSVGLITSTPPEGSGLLNWVMMSLDQPFEGVSYVGLYRRFQDFLIERYAQGGGTILIVDEAQNLGEGRLEELRMLSNINADKDQLLQMILVGQPQLRDLLQNPNMVQFYQRVSSEFHLRALSQEETEGYIAHRLGVAGGDPSLFTTEAKHAIFRASGGVPRVINILCDTCLVYGFAMEAPAIESEIVYKVLEDKRQHGVFSQEGHERQPVSLRDVKTGF
jgi:general secretion pathway protein A